MTTDELHQIVRDHGLSYAEHCLDQLASQVGRSTLTSLYDELGRMQAKAWEDHCRSCEGLDLPEDVSDGE